MQQQEESWPNCSQLAPCELRCLCSCKDSVGFHRYLWIHHLFVRCSTEWHKHRQPMRLGLDCWIVYCRMSNENLYLFQKESQYGANGVQWIIANGSATVLCLPLSPGPPFLSQFQMLDPWVLQKKVDHSNLESTQLCYNSLNIWIWFCPGKPEPQ